MSELFVHIFNRAISGGWLILAVILLRLLLKKSPKYIRCGLWAVVGWKLIVPFSLPGFWSILPTAELFPKENLTDMIPVIQTGIPAVNHVVNPIVQAATWDYWKENRIHFWPTTIQLISVIWLAGVILLLAHSAISYLRLKKRVNVSVRLDGDVYLCDRIRTPFIFGIRKPRIYLPSDMSREQMEQVLLHERAHLMRRDHWWKPLGYLVMCIYWFQPLVWISYVLLCRDIEAACDERVIRDMGAEEKKTYSQTLLDCSVPKNMLSACPLAFGEVGIKGRIRAVLNYRTPGTRVIVVAVIAAVLVALGFLADPGGGIELPADQNYMPSPFDFDTKVQQDAVLYDNPQDTYVYSSDKHLMFTFLRMGKVEYSRGIGTDDISIPASEKNYLKNRLRDLLETTGQKFDLLKDTKRIWEMQNEEDGKLRYHYVLQQNNQDLYWVATTAESKAGVRSAQVNCVLKLWVTSDIYFGEYSDKIYFDIDHDGIKELCLLGPGNGCTLEPLTLIVIQNGKKEMQCQYYPEIRNEWPAFQVAWPGRLQITSENRQSSSAINNPAHELIVVGGKIFVVHEGKIFEQVVLKDGRYTRVTYQNIFGKEK